MKKGYFEDIKPLSHRDGTTAKEKKAKVLAQAQEVPEERSEHEILHESLTPHERELENEIRYESTDDDKPTKGWGTIAWKVFGILVFVGAIVYGVSYYLKSAIVTVTPQSAAGAASVAVTLSEDGSSGITYQLVTLPKSNTKETTATHTDILATKAKGSVILYNTQSTSQSLVATTRFTDMSGTLFRLDKPVTIPKQTGSTPGQATVTLIADQAGTIGNIGLSDFTVVAFKGTAKEKQVYGRGKTAFTGGASGPAYYLTDEEYKAIITPLAQGLEESLKADIVKQVPEGYVLLPNSLAYLPDPIVNPGPSSSATITVAATAKMRGVLVKASDLAELILKNIAPQETATKDQITIQNIEGLTYQSTTNLTQAILPETFPETITGDATVVWNIDQDAIKHALAGVSRRDFAQKMQPFISIKEAALTLTPFWVSKLPTDLHKITIKITK